MEIRKPIPLPYVTGDGTKVHISDDRNQRHKSTKALSYRGGTNERPAGVFQTWVVTRAVSLYSFDLSAF